MRIEDIPIAPYIKYIMSSAEQIKGMKLRKMNPILKAIFFNLSIMVFLEFMIIYSSCILNLQSTKYTKKERKDKINIAVEPITPNHS